MRLNAVPKNATCPHIISSKLRFRYRMCFIPPSFFLFSTSMILAVLLNIIANVSVYRDRNQWMNDSGNVTTNATLVVFMGQFRGSVIAWDSARRNLLETLNADVAVLTNTSTIPSNLPFKINHFWSMHEYDDWGDALDEIRARDCPEVPPDAWRRVCRHTEQLLSGVGRNCGKPGSGAINMVLRDFVLRNIMPLLQKYEWFIVTRTDFLYACPRHLDPSRLRHDVVYVPRGEEYGGYTDRHVVAHRSIITRVLNLTSDLVCRPDIWIRNPPQNIEQSLKFWWERVSGLTVRRFPRSMFTVRAPKDPTRWSTGTYDAELNMHGLLSKYPDELTQTRRFCGDTFSIDS